MLITYRILWKILLLLAVQFNICQCTRDSWLIQTLEDDIGTENFTYYRLQRQGNMRLELVSLQGDVDIYVSSTVTQPDYSNYDLKSETCGIDIISIPSSMPRPVYLGLFGHPNNLQSKYRLSIFEVDDPIVDDYESLVDKYERYYYEEMDAGTFDPHNEKDTHSKSSSQKSPKVDHRVDDELPLWWNIFIDTLKFIVEMDHFLIVRSADHGGVLKLVVAFGLSLLPNEYSAEVSASEPEGTPQITVSYSIALRMSTSPDHHTSSLQI